MFVSKSMNLCVMYLQVCSFQHYRLDFHADEEATGWGYLWLFWLVHKDFVATRIVCVCQFRVKQFETHSGE